MTTTTCDTCTAKATAYAWKTARYCCTHCARAHAAADLQTVQPH
jgi:hypothetical protein